MVEKKDIGVKENKIFKECLNRYKHSFFMFSEKERYILNWIREVSKIRSELKGFAICPFASNSKYKIIECSAKEIQPIEEYQVIIYIIEDYFDLNMFIHGLIFITQSIKIGNFLKIVGLMIHILKELKPTMVNIT